MPLIRRADSEKELPGITAVNTHVRTCCAHSLRSPSIGGPGGGRLGIKKSGPDDRDREGEVFTSRTRRLWHAVRRRRRRLRRAWDVVDERAPFARRAVMLPLRHIIPALCTRPISSARKERRDAPHAPVTKCGAADVAALAPALLLAAAANANANARARVWGRL